MLEVVMERTEVEGTIVETINSIYVCSVLNQQVNNLQIVLVIIIIIFKNIPCKTSYKIRTSTTCKLCKIAF